LRFEDREQAEYLIAEYVRKILEILGEDPNRDGLKKTPERVARTLLNLTAGKYVRNVGLQVQFTERSDLVIAKDISFFSLCEHHLLPFFGTVDIAYIPRKKRVVGASKIVRCVMKHARRLQIQERMTSDIANEIWNELEPHGVMVVCKAQHLCMMMRGVRNSGKLVTSALKGIFMWSEATRNEALKLIG